MLTYRSQVELLALEGKGRGAPGYAEMFETRERANDLVGHAVGEVVGLRIVAQVEKGVLIELSVNVSRRVDAKRIVSRAARSLADCGRPLISRTPHHERCKRWSNVRHSLGQQARPLPCARSGGPATAPRGRHFAGE